MEKWAYPYEVKKITVGEGIRMAYVDEGEGPVLLFIHGLGSNLKGWKKNIDVLRNNYRCLAIDLPNYGKSSGGEFSFRMTFFAAKVLEFMQALALKEVTLVGHSMGAQIAVHAALSGDQRIRSLVLIAPAGFERFSRRDALLLRSVYTPTLLRAMPASQIIRNFEMNFFQMPEDARFMIEDRMILRKTEAYLSFCRMLPKCVMSMLKEPIFDQLPYVIQPALIIFGRDDLLIPNRLLHSRESLVDIARAGHSQMPNSDLHILPGCGHFVQWEASIEVNRLTHAFLQQHLVNP
jgi:pimeloyl-ACP methyl ester carboxylesterase